MDGVRRIMNQKEVTEEDTGDIEQWRVLIITGIIIIYLLTPWSRVLLEKLASLQLVKKFPAFYGTRRFLTALTRAPHLSLS